MSSQSPPPSEAIRQGVPRMSSFSSVTSSNVDYSLRLPKKASTTAISLDREAPIRDDGDEAPDAFESGVHSDNEENAEPGRGSVELDELPIELITLTDRYAYVSPLFYLSPLQLLLHRLVSLVVEEKKKQFHRISQRQKPSHACRHRKAVAYVPRLLCLGFLSRQYAHKCTSHQTETRGFTCPFDIIHLLCRQQTSIKSNVDWRQGQTQDRSTTTTTNDHI